MGSLLLASSQDQVMSKRISHLVTLKSVFRPFAHFDSVHRDSGGSGHCKKRRMIDAAFVVLYEKNLMVGRNFKYISCWERSSEKTSSESVVCLGRRLATVVGLNTKGWYTIFGISKAPFLV